MKLTYGFLCNYAAPGAGNKPTAVGIFDAVFIDADAKVVFPDCFIHGHFTTTGELATKHVFTFELLDEDGKTVVGVELAGELVPGADGLGRGNYFYVRFGSFELPAFGDYEIVLKAGGIRFAEIPVYVRKLVGGQVVQA